MKQSVWANGEKDKKQLIWICRNAMHRCADSKFPGYMNYGGRGIRFRFSNILDGAKWIAENLGTRPSSRHSLDRIDNDGHYEPGNLRWATHSEQQRNRRHFKRKAKSIVEFSTAELIDELMRRGSNL